jgi:hypothetical protein
MNAPERVAFNGVAQAAKASGLHPHHIRQARASGDLKSYAVARRTVILRDDRQPSGSVGRGVCRRVPCRAGRHGVCSGCAMIEIDTQDLGAGYWLSPLGRLDRKRQRRRLRARARLHRMRKKRLRALSSPSPKPPAR